MMTAKARPSTEAICCGIFRAEMERLGPGVLQGARPVFFDSMMHMRPRQLDEKLLALPAGQGGRRTLLVYGDCCPHMAEIARRPGVRRVSGVNCCEIMLGPARYRALRQEGAFLFLPEWTVRWERVFKQELGLADPGLAREFMAELHRRLVYVDTGVAPVPHGLLADIAAHFAMPVDVIRTGLEPLEQALAEGMRRVTDAS